MHEIIHLSLSSTANHLHTHLTMLKNHILYIRMRTVQISKVDPHVLFRQAKAFTPRALIWELRGGYGSMKQFNTIFNDDKDSSSNDVDNSGVWNSTTTETLKELPIQKSPYQSALDLGLYGSDLPRLNTKNTPLLVRLLECIFPSQVIINAAQLGNIILWIKRTNTRC